MKQNIYHLIMAAMLVVLTVNVATAQQPHVYINPGHGGYDSDDRNMVIYPFTQGDSAGSWESKSNLRKGIDDHVAVIAVITTVTGVDIDVGLLLSHSDIHSKKRHQRHHH